VSILCSSTHVAVYEMPVEGDAAGQWQRLDIEGPLFVVYRKDSSGGPSHRVVVTNRKSPQNFVNDITPGAMSFETADRMIMFEDAKGRVTGLWFFVEEDLQRVFDFMAAIGNGTDLPVLPAVAAGPGPSAGEGSYNSGQRERQKRRPKVGRPGQVTDRSEAEQHPAAKPSVTVQDAKDSKEKEGSSSEKPLGIVETNQEISSPGSRFPERVVPKNRTKEGKEDDSIERFFPNIKLTNGVAGICPPVELTKESEIENRGQKTASQIEKMTTPWKEPGAIPEVLPTRIEVNTAAKADEVAHGSSELQEQPAQRKTQQNDSMASGDDSGKSSNGTVGGIDSSSISMGPPFMSSGPGLMPFPPLHMSHGLPLGAQHGVHHAHYQHALQSKISMLQNQMMVLAVRKQQLAAQASSQQQQQQLQSGQSQMQHQLQQQEQQHLHHHHQPQNGPSSAPGPTADQVEMRLILNQQMQLQQTIGQLQQQIAHQQIAQQQQLAMVHGGLVGVRLGAGGGSGNNLMGHMLPTVGLPAPAAVPSVHGGLLAAASDYAESARNVATLQAADGRRGVTPLASEVRLGGDSSRLSPQQRTTPNVGRVGSAIAATALDIDQSAALDRAHFRGMLQRLLTDRKLFEQAYAHYSG
jgi:Dcp1-like decapping family